MKNAVIYVRVRTDGNHQAAVEHQSAVCTQFAEEQGLTVVGKYIERERFGMNCTRPMLARILQDSFTFAWDTVIVCNADRICRDMNAYTAYREELEKHGKTLLCAASADNGDAYLKLRQCMKEIEKELIVRRKSK